MKTLLFKCAILFVLIVGLPLFGVVASGNPIAAYLEFPPETRYIVHAPFSWTAFLLFGLLIAAFVLPMARQAFSVPSAEKSSKIDNRGTFPPWGFFAVLTGALFWVLAWTRFEWFEPFQSHTFTPLWLSYIVVINALTKRKTGRCMLCNRPRFFLLLFPTSAVFWWFFEYLNRFVQNWTYIGTVYTPWEYFWHATISFSTVLPAVLGTRDWIHGCRWIKSGFACFQPLRIQNPKTCMVVVFFLSAIGLFGIGIWPDYFFPILWVSPLLIILSLQVFLNENHIFSSVADGDWRLIVSAATAALCCGFFWEMWNFYSLPKWEYHVPFVHRFQIFEMPVLGYAGYLPFGLECAVIGELMENHYLSMRKKVIYRRKIARNATSRCNLLCSGIHGMKSYRVFEKIHRMFR